MDTPPSSLSRLPRPTLVRSSPSSSSNTKYVSPSSSSTTRTSRSRSKSHLSQQPKILPFPELSLRAQEAQRTSREGSRATSPMSTPPIDRLEVTFDQLVSMSRGGSSEGNNHSRSSGNSLSVTTVPSSSGIVGSTSPPVPSPLAISAARLSRARASTAPSRPRTPGVHSTIRNDESTADSPTPMGRPIHPSSSGLSTISHRRTEGFRPSSTGIARVTTNNHPSSIGEGSSRPTTVMPSNTPTPLPISNAQSRSAPTSSLLSPSVPHTPAKIHSSSHPTHMGHLSQTSRQSYSSASTTAVTPTPSNAHIKDHLYQSFLKGICADVRLIIRKWGVCYHVHRMILAQMNFFHTLFLGGFSEAHISSVRTSGKGKERAGISRIVTEEEWNGEDVELTFDDPNITRAAFEICLSRLYSPYPHLQFPTELLPTSTHPLTPPFPNITSSPNYETMRSDLPPRTQLATPRLLLSLLATTIYLGHTVIMREVLSIILRTVGPLTITRYLSFALGDGIGEEEYSGQTEEGVNSLLGVSKDILDVDGGSRRTSDEDLVEDALHSINHTPQSSSDSGKIGNSSQESLRHGGIPIPAIQIPSRSNSIRSNHRISDDPFSFNSSMESDTSVLPLTHYYGVVGNKIGEACCCWLARWGIDLLNAELKHPTSIYKVWSHGGLPANLVRAVLSSDYFYVPNEMERYRFARKVLDLRRAGWDEETQDQGDISLATGSGLGLGMEGTHTEDDQWEEWEEEENELLRTFAEGIYYCHMTFDDLSTIASDIDPSTHLPYAPLSILQAAHWTAADLRSRVTAHEKAGTTTAADEENELGLTQTTSSICTTSRRRRPATRSRVPSPAIMSASPWAPSSPSLTLDSLPSLNAAQQTVWHPVPTDETLKIGASGMSLLTTSTQTQNTALGDMPDFGPDPFDDLNHRSTDLPKETSRKVPHGEKTAFGLISAKATGKEIEDKWINEGGINSIQGLGLNDSSTPRSDMVMNEERWTKIQPYRFSVEFFDIDKLTEKERFYSNTHFYAGSYFNCYVQMIKRKEKGLQLGIYLHRQSPNEPFPIPSKPRTSITQKQASLDNNNNDNETIEYQNRNLSTSPLMVNNSPTTPNPMTTTTTNLPFITETKSQIENNKSLYLDNRLTTKAYFSISCSSSLGTSLIKFSSGPDSFALSQSWGWKSSALKSEEYLSIPISNSNSISINNKEQISNNNDEQEDVLGWIGDLPSSSSSTTTTTTKTNSNLSKFDQCSLRATVIIGVV
ncbi:uncharacterized protein I206_100256 [Kwoniella pini CBS 10737]|uniref:BTB domain-containing protein n=1 Tax=Kwoniella pini CBS 10737 TaxID=1296096 RepID=A0A1B9IDY4_9TREE|nr:uncharacterized protein I206_01069 [Kwoniella pini CBS 10737]OCF53762.1 hypothetical protein I206_01069 [Kwoniella pini CBS 10737]